LNGSRLSSAKKLTNVHGQKNPTLKRETTSNRMRVVGIYGNYYLVETGAPRKDGLNLMFVKRGEVKESLLVTKEQLDEMGFASSLVTTAMVKDLNRVLYKYDITSIANIRHFLSQCGTETGWGETLVEGSSGSGMYKGAGYIQLTGPVNYKAFAEYIGDPKVYTVGCTHVAANYPSTFNIAQEALLPSLRKQVDDGNLKEEIFMFAAVIYGEVGDPRYPKKEWWAVACVVRNRIKASGWSNEYYDVLTQSKQFDAYLKPKYKAAMNYLLGYDKYSNPGDLNKSVVLDCLHIALSVYFGVHSTDESDKAITFKQGTSAPSGNWANTRTNTPLTISEGGTWCHTYWK